MTLSLRRTFASFALMALIAPLAAPSYAESLASSASSTASASVGSLSDSLRGSSDSSSPNRVAAGDHRVIEVAAVADKPGTLRVTLEPVNTSGNAQAFRLDLPQPLALGQGIAPGAIVAARERPYGVEFAKGEPAQAFFLVLADDWYRELQSRAL
jgi:hypothetical protein